MNDTRTDLTREGDEELSLQFQNDTTLYSAWNRAIRLTSFQEIKTICDEYFIYTTEQLNVIKEEFDKETAEDERE